MLYRLIPLFLLLVLSAPTLAQNTGAPLTLVSYETQANLPDRLGLDSSTLPQTLTLSPDAAYIAWVERAGLCVYSFDADATACTPYPEDLRAPRSDRPLYWSPDSAYIVLHQDFFRLLQDSDLIVYDRAAAAYIVRTDDGFDDANLMRSSDEDFPPQDVLPSWDPVSGDLYFMRLQRTGLDAIPYAQRIMRIPAAEITSDTEPEVIADLTAVSLEPDFYELGEITLDGTLSVSPDGTRAAFIVRPRNRDDWLDAMAVWTVDLTDGSLTQIINQGAITASGGLPDFVIELPDLLLGETFAGLGWVDAERLVLGLRNDLTRSVSPITPITYLVDVTTASAQPVTDFSAVADNQAFYSMENTPNANDRHWEPLVVPGTGLMLVHNVGFLGEDFQLSVLALDAAPTERQVLLRLSRDDWGGPQPELRQGSIGITEDGTIRVLTAGTLVAFTLAE